MLPVAGLLLAAEVPLSDARETSNLGVLAAFTFRLCSRTFRKCSRQQRTTRQSAA
jgi:hypothetical protein